LLSNLPYPGVQFAQPGGSLTRIYGVPFGYGLSARQTADSFVQTHSPVFGVDPGDLRPGNGFNDRLTQPLGYEPQTGTYKFTLVYYRQFRDGIPVYGGELRLLVRNEPSYPLVLAVSNLRDLGGFTVPDAAVRSVARDAGLAAAAAARPGLVNFEDQQVVIWAGLDGANPTPVLALHFVADNGMPASADYEKYRFITDAATGQILYEENLIYHTDVIGSVRGMATVLPGADVCDVEVDTPMPWARVNIGGTVAYADGNGNFTISNAGNSPVVVQSPVRGLYFWAHNQGGSDTVLSQTVTPPGPANFMHNSANNDEFKRAEVNAYVQANLVRDFVLGLNPSYPTIGNQTEFAVNVNLNETCNAYYDGSSINFFRSGGGCANTAFSSVVHHEYGHHLVNVGGSGQGEYGEGMSDCIAMLISDDPRLGVGFMTCSSGIRNADNNCQYDRYNCSTCGSEIHDCGQLLSGCVWSTRQELEATHPGQGLDIIRQLTVDSILLHGTGTEIDRNITIDFLTLDDDDDNLTNGTPHYDEITAGFAAHNMWLGPAPGNDDCSQAIEICHGRYTHLTDLVTNDGSSSCDPGSTTPDAWFVFRSAVDGLLRLKLCESDYDTVLSVHTGCPGTPANQVSCNNDTGWYGLCGKFPTYQSALVFWAVAGQPYYIRVSGYNGATGQYVLVVEGVQCACTENSECDDGNVCNGTEYCDPLGRCLRALTADCNANGQEDACDIAQGLETDFNANGVPDECEGLGDMNCDGYADFRDINPFVVRLVNPTAYAAGYPGCPDAHGDINGDGIVSFKDINPFVVFMTRR